MGNKQDHKPGTFLSTLSLRRATRNRSILMLRWPISIHALLAESDIQKEQEITGKRISIHALLAESDWLELFLYYQDNRFLSTLSLRRATGCQRPCEHPTRDFYPRSPCGERPAAPKTRREVWPFLSTLSLRRATIDTSKDVIKTANFYPRSPCGERHDATLHCLRVMRISIHALLAESDSKSAQNSGALLRI